MPEPAQPQAGEQEQIKAAVTGTDPNAPQDNTNPEGTALGDGQLNLGATPPPGMPGAGPAAPIGLSPDPTQPPAPGVPGAQDPLAPLPGADPSAQPGQDHSIPGEVDSAQPPLPGAPPTQGQNPSAPGSPPQEQGLPELHPPGAPTEPSGSSVTGMQPSLMDGPEPEAPQEDPGALPAPEPGADPYAQPQGAEQGYYDPYASSGSDAISEVAEQIVAEKLAPIRRAVEDTLDHRTVVESKLIHLNDRLKRIETIIDELQMSVLQKVGQYVTDVSDLKKEMIETQKSFKAVHKRNRKK